MIRHDEDDLEFLEVYESEAGAMEGEPVVRLIRESQTDSSATLIPITPNDVPKKAA